MEEVELGKEAIVGVEVGAVSNHGAVAGDFFAGATAFVVVCAFDEKGFIADLTSEGDGTIKGIVDDAPNAGVGFNECLITIVVIFGFKQRYAGRSGYAGYRRMQHHVVAVVVVFGLE